MALPFPDLLDTDALLSDEERDIRETTRKLVDDLVRPSIAEAGVRYVPDSSWMSTIVDG